MSAPHSFVSSLGGRSQSVGMSPQNSFSKKVALSSASSSTAAVPYGSETHGILVAGGVTGRPGGGGQRFERSIVEDTLSGLLAETRKEIQRDVQNLHLDMLRQFEDQQAAIASMLEEYTHRLAQLVHENDALRKENEQLRSLY